jgi:gliding motility-associated transport system permease protein
MTLLHIVSKELRHYLYSPVAYMLAGVFHCIIGFFFYNSLVFYSRRVVEMSGSGQPTDSFTPMVVILQGLFNSMGLILVLLTPLITMRLVSEEKRSKTMEFLMTSPTSLLTFLCGKYLAAWIVYLVIIITTVYIPITLHIFSRINWWQVGSAYLGLMLVGGAMISVGLFTSTLTDKQVVAAVLSIGILIIFWFLGGGIGMASQRGTYFLREISLYTPFRNMTMGLIDLRDIVYLTTFTLTLLFLSQRVLESERW